MTGAPAARGQETLPAATAKVDKEVEILSAVRVRPAAHPVATRLQTTELPVTGPRVTEATKGTLVIAVSGATARAAGTTTAEEPTPPWATPRRRRRARTKNRAAEAEGLASRTVAEIHPVRTGVRVMERRTPGRGKRATRRRKGPRSKGRPLARRGRRKQTGQRTEAQVRCPCHETAHLPMATSLTMRSMDGPGTQARPRGDRGRGAGRRDPG